MKAIRTDRGTRVPWHRCRACGRAASISSPARRHPEGDLAEAGRRRGPAAHVLHARDRAGHRRRRPGSGASSNTASASTRSICAAAMRRGIPVVNVPEYAEETVAEGAFALMIALAKRLPAITRAVRQNGWIWPAQRWLGRDIAGSTLGLVGCGRIGRSMARMAGQGFRARVLGFDPHVDADTMRAVWRGEDRRSACHAAGLRFRFDPLCAERRNARPDRANRIGVPEAVGDPHQRVARCAHRRDGACRGDPAPDASAGSGSMSILWSPWPGPAIRSPAVRSRRRHPVSTPDVFHGGSHAASRRGHAGAMLRDPRGQPVTIRSRDPRLRAQIRRHRVRLTARPARPTPMPGNAARHRPVTWQQ